VTPLAGFELSGDTSPTVSSKTVEVDVVLVAAGSSLPAMETAAYEPPESAKKSATTDTTFAKVR